MYNQIVQNSLSELDKVLHDLDKLTKQLAKKLQQSEHDLLLEQIVGKKEISTNDKRNSYIRKW